MRIKFLALYSILNYLNRLKGIFIKLQEYFSESLKRSFLNKNWYFYIVLSLVFICISSFFYFTLSKFQINDDDASFMLTSKDLSDGNFFLNGWAVAGDDALWKLSLLLYALFIKMFGIKTAIVPFVKALIYSSIICFSIYVIYYYCKDNKILRIFILLPFLLFPTGFFLYIIRYGSHWGGLLCVIVSVILSERFLSGKGTNLCLVGIFSILTIGKISDPIVLYLGIIPLIFTILLDFLKVQESRSNIRYYKLLSLLIMSVITSHFLLYMMTHNSSLVFVKTPANFVEFKDVFRNFYLFLQITLKTFGSYFFGRNLLSIHVFFNLMGLIYLSIIIKFFLSTARGIFFKNIQEDFLTRAFVCIAVFDFAAFIFSDQASNLKSGRYLIFALLFLIIVASRFQKITQVDLVALKILLVFLLPASAIGFSLAVHHASEYEIISYNGPLMQYLDKHKISVVYGPEELRGLEILSHGRVKVRPVLCFHSDLVPFFYAGKPEWYKNFGNSFQRHTVVLLENPSTPETINTTPLNSQCAISAFGNPDEVVRKEGFLILTWSRPDYSKRASSDLLWLTEIDQAISQIKRKSMLNLRDGILGKSLGHSLGYLPNNPYWSPLGLFLKEGNCISQPLKACEFVGLLGNKYEVSYVKNHISNKYKWSTIISPRYFWPYPNLGGTLEETSQYVLIVELAQIHS